MEENNKWDRWKLVIILQRAKWTHLIGKGMCNAPNFCCTEVPINLLKTPSTVDDLRTTYLSMQIFST